MAWVSARCVRPRVEPYDANQWHRNVAAAIEELRDQFEHVQEILDSKVSRKDLQDVLAQQVSRDEFLTFQRDIIEDQGRFQRALGQKVNQEDFEQQLSTKVGQDGVLEALDRKVGQEDFQQQLETKVSQEDFWREILEAFQEFQQMSSGAEARLTALEARIQQSEEEALQLRRCQDEALTVPVIIGPNPEDVAFLPEPKIAPVDDSSLRAYALQGACWSGLIDVSTTQHYTIKALVRSVAGFPTDAAHLYVAVKCFDANKNEISVFERTRTGTSVRIVGVQGRTLQLEHAPAGWCRGGPCHCRSLLFFKDGVTDRRPDRLLRNQHDYRSLDAEHGAYSKLDGAELHLNVDPPLDVIDVGVTKVQNVRGANTYMHPCGSHHPASLSMWTELQAFVGPGLQQHFWEWTRYIKLGVTFGGGYDDGRSGPIPAYQLRHLGIELRQ